MNKLLALLFLPLLSFSQIVTEDCNSIPDPGNCLAAFQIYYFNQSTGLCEESLWGGCDGLVPFWTLEECQNSCEFNSFIEEIEVNKVLVKTIDLLGREVTKKGFQLEIFDDGSVNKKYLLK
tara:strand:+ start:396 stop:758 length:363 start_codon:yes stop_codon:yes gene_type:complete